MGKFHVDKDNSGEFRWILVAPNGKIIADSAEGDSSKPRCIEGIADVEKDAGTSETVGD